jgi:hypothetical protein
MRASVRLRAPDGNEHELVSGQFVGRAWTSDLRIDDGRVSEAHALVSLRGGDLQLLALRGVFAIDGQRQTKATLRPGMVIHLADDLAMEVLEVALPAEVLALQGPGLPTTVLSSVCSLVFDPHPSLQPGYVRRSPLRLWPGPNGWSVEANGPARPTQADDHFVLPQGTFRITTVDLDLAALGATRAEGGLRTPLHIVARFDSVHIHAANRPPVSLSGIPARLVSELVAMDGPVPWDVLAQQLWPKVDDRHIRRRRLDLTLSRLRRHLKEEGVRADLIRSDRTGHVELLLDPDDLVEDDA